jgi:hypothetical protein
VKCSLIREPPGVLARTPDPRVIGSSASFGGPPPNLRRQETAGWEGPTSTLISNGVN